MHPLRLGPRRPPLGRIVVVDDETPIHALLTRFLHAEGYEVTIASDADKAIELLQHSEVDLVILDVVMSRRSGLDVLVFMRRDTRLRGVPVLILTGATLTAAERQLAAEHDAEIVYKPHSLTALGESVASILAVHHTSTNGQRGTSAIQPSIRDGKTVRVSAS
jgi:DNA-binding response OmpR family regulator